MEALALYEFQGNPRRLIDCLAVRPVGPVFFAQFTQDLVDNLSEIPYTSTCRTAPTTFSREFPRIFSCSFTAVHIPVAMTSLQAKILYTIVQYGKSHGMRVPTAQYVAQNLLKTKAKARSPERNMSAHIHRLQAQYDFFRTEGRQRYIKDVELVTEPESALYLVELDRMCQLNPESRVFKDDLHKYLRQNNAINTDVLEQIFITASKNQYVESIMSAPGYLRPALRTTQLLPYLVLLAEHLPNCQPQPQIGAQ